MKIKNISSTQLTLALNKHTVILQPGQIVYTEPKTDTRQLIVYEKKKAIEITDDDKPKNGQYYHPYSILDKKTTSHSIPIVPVYEEEDDDEVIDVPAEVKIPDISDDVVEEEDEVPFDTADADLDEDDDEDDNESDDEEGEAEKDGQPKNKGGRPKGSKNKSKAGRPKVKRKPGRPSKKKKVSKSKIKTEDSNTSTPEAIEPNNNPTDNINPYADWEDAE